MTADRSKSAFQKDSLMGKAAKCEEMRFPINNLSRLPKRGYKSRVTADRPKSVFLKKRINRKLVASRTTHVYFLQNVTAKVQMAADRTKKCFLNTQVIRKSTSSTWLPKIRMTADRSENVLLNSQFNRSSTSSSRLPTIAKRDCKSPDDRRSGQKNAFSTHRLLGNQRARLGCPKSG